MLVTSAKVLGNFGHSVTIVSSLTKGVSHDNVDTIHVNLTWDSYRDYCYTDAINDAHKQLWTNEKFQKLYDNRAKLDVIILREDYNGFVLPIMNGSNAKLILYKEHKIYPVHSMALVSSLLENGGDAICALRSRQLVNELNLDVDPYIADVGR